jgi:hypothetical protein
MKTMIWALALSMLAGTAAFAGGFTEDKCCGDPACCAAGCCHHCQK